MAAKDERGRAGEERAAQYLRDAGFEVLDRNWRCPQGELDIVAARGDDLIAVEVKTRRNDWFGHPFEAIDRRKRARLWRLSCAWIAAHRTLAAGRRLRLDVIGVTGEDPATGIVEHLEDLA